MTRAGWRLDPRAGQAARRMLGAVGVAAGYYGGAVVGTVLSVPPSGFAIIWPATAFLIAILMIEPVRRWPLDLALVVPAHLHMVAHFQQGEASLVVMLTQVAGNIGLAAATVLVVRAATKAPLRFDDFRSALRFIVIACVAVPAVGNALILCLHLLTGWTETFWLSWRQWMLASIFPTLTIPPAVMLAAHGAPEEAGETPAAALELAGVCGLLFTLAFLTFGWVLEHEWWPGLVPIFLPLMLWVAVRFSVGATSLALLFFSAAIIIRALHGEGPFAVGASPESVVSLQVFLTTLSVPLILLSALTRERRRMGELLRRSEARMQVVAASTDTAFWQWDTVRKQLWMTDYCRSMFGVEPGPTLTPNDFLPAVHEEDRPKIEAAFGPMFTAQVTEASIDFRVVRPGEEQRWFHVHAHADLGGDGVPILISGVVRDITQRIIAQHEIEALRQSLLALQEEERQKIAGELHESTAQNLVAVGLNLAVLKRRAPLGEGAGAIVEKAFASLNQAKTELRTFTYLLRPAGLDREGLCAVLRRHVEGFGRWTGLKARFTSCPEADDLLLGQQQTVLRVVQESLMNVHRHAGATQVFVRLRRMGDAIHLVVRDDGEGMREESGRRTEEPPQLGVGIPGMTARVRQIGGEIVIRSSHRGTVVHAVVPIAPAAGQAASSLWTDGLQTP